MRKPIVLLYYYALLLTYLHHPGILQPFISMPFSQNLWSGPQSLISQNTGHSPPLLFGPPVLL